MFGREWRARLADWICLRLAPGKFLINPAFRPFGVLEDEFSENSAALAAQHLIAMCHEANQDRLIADLEGYSVLGVEAGDWRVTVERIMAPEPRDAA